MIENSNMTKNIYEQLLALNQQAFEAGIFDVAYHTLTAALACAKNLKNSEAIQYVARTGREQLQIIDKLHPEYRHSTKSAHTRGNESVFRVLFLQADALLSQQHIEKRQKALRARFR